MINQKGKLRASAPILLTFFILAVVFYWLGYWLIFRLERATPLMMSVGLAAVVSCLIHGRPLASLGLLWGKSRFQWASFLIPLATVSLSYLIIWGLGLAQFNLDFIESLRGTYNLADWNGFSIILFHVALSATFTLCLAVPSILGEEIAWRGLLVGELSKSLSFGSVALISGLLWSVFHWPLMMKGFYGSEFTPFVFQLAIFTLFIVSSSVTMTYLRYKTNSVWTAVLFHASSNIFIQKVFTPLTVVDESSSWYVDEFGVVVPLLTFLVALYFWTKAKREFA
ncbi:MAG: membrane protease YdiL (CAAX protease family) [Cryomorphaceae bacterium]|jgi:membrane protease YdiL (CAAX protease family)